MKDPFLGIVVVAASGVVAARTADVPATVATACAIAIWALAIKNRRDLYVWAAVFLSFFATTAVMRPRAGLPQGRRVEMVAQIGEHPVTRGRWQTAEATVGWFWDDGWRRVNEKIQLSVDTCYRVEQGEQFGFRAWVNPIDSGSYGRLMALRGVFSRAYLTSGNLIKRAPHRSKTPAYYGARLQQAAVRRLGKLNLKPSSRGVVEAMAAGWRGDVDRTTRREYSATGAAHLLAVSGLHVGIVFVLVNLVLWLLPRGRWRAGVAVAAIWAYAMVSGLAPSAVRAALMFSFAQMALASGGGRSALNIVAGSATVMLALNPRWLGDASFMLSFAAVISIIVFFKPIYERVKTRHSALNALISAVIVGFVASVGTAPMVALWFDQVPVAGVLLSPLVTFTAHAIVGFGVLAMIVPTDFFGAVLNAAAGVQNAAVGWAADHRWATIDTPETPLWAVLAAYFLMGILAFYVTRRDRHTA